MSLSDQQWSPTSVQVTVLQARGLRIKGKSGTNDAYAVMQVAKEKYQTSVAEKSVAPVWQEEAAFDLPAAGGGGGGGGTERTTLHVHVLHRALVGPDKLLGQAVINLLQLSEDKSRAKTEWFKLLDKTGKPDKDRGEVRLDIQFMRNNMTCSMFDLSAAGKSRSRLGKLKDKVRGKKKESDSASGVVPSFSQVLTDSEDEANGDGKTKKHKKKSLFSPKSNLQKTLSQSMSVLPATNSSLSGSQSSGLNLDSSQGKKKFKFKIHKRSGSSDLKDSSSGQKQVPVEQSNLCINGSHVYCEEPPARTSRIGSNFSLTSSGHGSVEYVPENSPQSVESLRGSRQCSPWTEEEEEEEEAAAAAAAEDENKEEVDESREEEEEKSRMEEVRKKREEEEGRKQQEEFEKLSEEMTRHEQEKRSVEEEKYKREEEEKTRREEEVRAKRERETLKKQEEERERIESLERMQKEEGERIRLEEERKRIEEAERIKMEEEERIKLEEERKRIEEDKRIRLEEEERIRLEEERKRIEEEKRIKSEEEERIKLGKERKRIERVEQEEEQKRIEEEERVKQVEERKRVAEQMRIKMKEERKRIEMQERMQKEEEERTLLAEEKRRIEEEEKIRLEEERKRVEEGIRMEEERKRVEEKIRLEEERKRVEEGIRMEEERKRVEKIRLEEEEKKRVEDGIRMEEERKRVEEKIRLEEERKRVEEGIRMEEERKRVEEKIRLEEEERKRVEEEERKRVEEEERIRLQEESRVKMEAEMKRIEAEEERERKEQEMRVRREKEIRLERDERLKKEKMQEEERIRRVEEEERARKEKEEHERLLAEEERMRKEEQNRREDKTRKEMERAEQEKRVRKEKERAEREKEARRLEKERLEQEKKEPIKKVAGRRTKLSVPAEVLSTNPFDEDFSSDPFEEPSSSGPAPQTASQQRCQPAVSSSGSNTEEKDLIGSQREKRPAPQPPGRNQPERPCQTEQLASAPLLSQINKHGRDIKTISVPPQRHVQSISPLTRCPTDSRDAHSLTESAAVRETVKPAKRPAPSKPQPEELPPKSTGPHGSNTKQVQVVYGLNPFEDDEDENELAVNDGTAVSGGTRSVVWPPPVSPTADHDAASLAKIKSAKVARAPPPPAQDDPTSSATINQDTVPENTGGSGPDKAANKVPTEGLRSDHVEERPLQEAQPTAVQNGLEAGVKKQGPPVTSRRLQPVKPLNPVEQPAVSVVQGEDDNKSSGILSRDKTKIDTGNKGPYSQLTQEELISLVVKQERQLSEREKKISDLEQYIDSLLVRVIEEQPSILMSLSAMKKPA